MAIPFMRPCVLGILFVFNIVHLQAQCRYEATILVVEKHNSNPIYPAIIYIEPINKIIQTNVDGTAVVDSLCAGQYVFHIQAGGYKPIVDTVLILENTSLTFKTVFESHELKGFEIVDEHIRTIQQSRDQLNKKQLDEGSGKTLGALLEDINGVTTYANGATIAKPVIHGLHSNRIMILNNGIRQEDQQWGSEHAPNIDPFLASKVMVIKGAAGVRYGTDAIGGVVLVEPPALRSKTGWDGELNLAGFSNNRMGVGSLSLQHCFKTIPALSVRFQGSLKKGGNYRIPGYWAANTGVSESNYSATIGYRKLHYGAELFYSHFNTTLGLYRGSHTGNRADLMNAINSPVPLIDAGFTYDVERPKQQVTHNLIKAKLYVDSRAGLWNIVYGYQHNFRQEYDVMRVDNGKAQLNLTLNTQTLNVNLDHKPIKGIKGQVGIDAGVQDNFFKDGDRLFIPSYNSRFAGAYLIERYKLGSFHLEAGLRYDYRWYDVYNPEGNNQHIVNYKFDYNNISGTVGINQKLKENWDWSVTFANAWRAPQASELFSAGLHQGSARVEIGNKALSPERSYGLNVGTKYIWNNKLTTQIDAYSQLIDDYIFLEPGPDLLTIRGYFKTFNYKQTNAWLKGIDATVKYQWNDYLQSSFKGSMLRARDRSKHDWLILIPSDRLSLSSRYERSISSSLRECFVTIEGEYVFQQHRVPANFDSIDYPRPPGAYFLLNASIGTTISLFKKQSLYVSVAATNLLNESYRDYLDAFRYFINQPGTNIALRLRLPFEYN